MANARIQAHLVVDGVARGREPLFVLALGISEQVPHNAIVHLQNLIRDRGVQVQHERDQRGVAALWLQIPQMLCAHLRSLARELREPALMHRVAEALGPLHRTELLQPIKMYEDVAGLRREHTLHS